MKEYEKLLLENKAWSEERRASDPRYFARLASHNRPDYLWIGCSDARVPATEITGTQSGEMMVHRNLANLVVHSDVSIMSIVQFAIEEVGVDHIIVCGHYGCTGIKAALTDTDHGVMNTWLQTIKNVYRTHADELKPLESDHHGLAHRLVELNVEEQVSNLAKTAILQRAWQHGESPILHGWVYGLEDGLIRELCTHTSKDPIDPIFAFRSGAFDD